MKFHPAANRASDDKERRQYEHLRSRLFHFVKSAISLRDQTWSAMPAAIAGVTLVAGSSRSINQLLAEPTGDGGQAGLHQAGRGSTPPPFRAAISVGQGG